MSTETVDCALVDISVETYSDLKRMASQRLFRNPLRKLLSSTSLVHESILKIRTRSELQDRAQRKRFFATMAYIMRSVLVDVARHKNCQNRYEFVSRLIKPEPQYSDEHWQALDAAISKLCIAEPNVGQVVQLKVFSGLRFSEIADQLDISLRTAKRYWVFGKAWLKVELDNVG